MYYQFRDLMKSYEVFSIHDIEKTVPNFYTKNLVYWQKKGYITKIRNGFYYFTDTNITEEFLHYAANEIYKPSYISFETALSYYNVIPEGVFTIVSATTIKTNSFQTLNCKFGYIKIKPSLFFGYVIIDYGRYRVKMASLEKTILDYLYSHNTIHSYQDFESLRWNIDRLKNMDMTLFNNYLSLFNSKVLNKRVQHLKIYINA
jgi:predicted transcriptional regulator of viral defense system